MPCNIPWSVARDYAADHGYHLPTLRHVLRALDGVYGGWWAERAREEAKKNPAEE